MCFCAAASFTAGAVLSLVGVATLKLTKRREEVFFAMIPLLFGLQQFIEGLLWLSFQFEGKLLNVVMTYVFVLFSHVLWPVFVPFSIGFMETVPWRKKVIRGFQLTGIAVAAFLLYFIVRYPITSEIREHIVYVFPHFHIPPVLALYIAATCVSALFSSQRIVILFGALAFVLFVVAFWFYYVAFFSVWCFFAAILSVVIYLHFQFRHAQRSFMQLFIA
jgi:hypothetical protein